ncbi:uncharacterized protein F4822DRAFT_180809 [Hypoxylon trugodes]|uniref:uncharacterized protein n=1 Tax=Hypoxylon trugodes TaxID=326681 RepID=UPI00219FBD1D|nr:uncharacterized protein F4822DRAFT_180809 [Hypoxylon trugodes]KAI1391299.1 hypothetical protein F4822DRAFT_180809 [Hypoxylon trugodes]
MASIIWALLGVIPRNLGEVDPVLFTLRSPPALFLVNAQCPPRYLPTYLPTFVFQLPAINPHQVSFLLSFPSS